jgi:hypothetical protein
VSDYGCNQLHSFLTRCGAVFVMSVLKRKRGNLPGREENGDLMWKHSQPAPCHRFT